MTGRMCVWLKSRAAELGQGLGLKSSCPLSSCVTLTRPAPDLSPVCKVRSMTALGASGGSITHRRLDNLGVSRPHTHRALSHTGLCWLDTHVLQGSHSSTPRGGYCHSPTFQRREPGTQRAPLAHDTQQKPQRPEVRGQPCPTDRLASVKGSFSLLLLACVIIGHWCLGHSLGAKSEECRRLMPRQLRSAVKTLFPLTAHPRPRAG